MHVIVYHNIKCKVMSQGPIPDIAKITSGIIKCIKKNNNNNNKNNNNNYKSNRMQTILTVGLPCG